MARHALFGCHNVVASFFHFGCQNRGEGVKQVLTFPGPAIIPKHLFLSTWRWLLAFDWSILLKYQCRFAVNLIHLLA